MGPLEGVRVIDMTTVLMGPYATQTLGDYGADVIKVESLEGDVTRLIGPTRHPGMGPVFLNINRSKRSIALDLKKPAGRDAVLRLIASADVLVYNVRPQAMARLQLGYDVISEINPRLIYAGVFGFGPYAAKPAYDDLIQGATALPALMAKTGDGVPRYVPNALVDRIVGLTAVGAICASLVHRDRTGRGQRLDIPMFETMAGFVMGDHMGGLTYDPRSTREAMRAICRAIAGPTRHPTAISVSSSITTSSGPISSKAPAATTCAGTRNLRPSRAAPPISTLSMPNWLASLKRGPRPNGSTCSTRPTYR
jgi:crotonobetainyl-CoA:carnitine CoA-transferase CaiB-like acyl-CoA transferase